MKAGFLDKLIEEQKGPDLKIVIFFQQLGKMACAAHAQALRDPLPRHRSLATQLAGKGKGVSLGLP